MIRRRLIIVNIVILTLTLGLATIFETRALKSLLYRDNLSKQAQHHAKYVVLQKVLKS